MSRNIDTTEGLIGEDAFVGVDDNAGPMTRLTRSYALLIRYGRD